MQLLILLIRIVFRKNHLLLFKFRSPKIKSLVKLKNYVPQLKPVKKRCWNGQIRSAQVMQCEVKQSTESKIGKLCRPCFLVVDTPIVKNVFVNPESAANSKPAPIHLMNRRFHFAELDKLKDFPRTDLFAPEGMFDLHFSDSESGELDGRVNKAGPAAAAPVQEDVVTSNAASPPSNRPDSDCDAVITKVSPTVQLVREVKFSEKCSNMSKLTDHMYNSKFLHNVKNPLLATTEAKPLEVSTVQPKGPDAIYSNSPKNPSPPVNQFPVTAVSLRFYNILCGLAYSQWKGEVAVQFVKTTVTFESLGKSIEPGGHCDNFFIAGHCRNFFELSHPRDSRKHYFIQKLGHISDFLIILCNCFSVIE